MGIYIRKVDNCFGIWNNYESEFLNPSYLGITEKQVKDYVKNNPFPVDKLYSKDDCIYDLTESGGSLLMQCDLKTAEYITNMIETLI